MSKTLALSKKDSENIIHLKLNENWTYVAIAKRYNIDKGTASNIIQRGGLIKNKNYKYTADESFFETINTEEKAYWLGFNYADGYVRMKSENCGELVINLKKDDYTHLEKFKKSINFSGNIKFRKGIYIYKSKKKHQEICNISVSFKKIVKDLIKHGCVQAKSLILKFPTTVPENLIYHFVRGYFDGDGSISKDNKRSKSAYYISMLGTCDIIYNMQKFLKLYNIKSTITPKNSKRVCFVLKVIGGRTGQINFQKLLYQNATIFLDRKKEKFDNMISEYNIIKSQKEAIEKQVVELYKSYNSMVKIGKHILHIDPIRVKKILLKHNVEIRKF